MEKTALLKIKRVERGQHLFTNNDLFKLFIPLVIEQFLEYMVGLTASILVAHVGEAAVSGVSLVEFVMALLISIFAALATGGAVVAGQYMGNKQMKEANEASNQLIWFVGVTSAIIMVLIYLFRTAILHVLFGAISDEVYSHASTYLLIVAASIPFLGLYNATAAVFRTMGNSKLPMKVMLVMNVINVAMTTVLIFGFHMGTAGVAIPTLLCRMGAAIIILALVMNKNNCLYLKRSIRFKFDGTMIKQILKIGVPSGFENGMFYFGRLIILSLVSTFGTAAIAANSVGGTIVMFEVLPGMAVGLGLTVVISRCVGLGDYEQAKYYTKKIMGTLYVAQIISSAIVLALLPLILNIYSLSTEATLWTTQIVWGHAIVMILIWPLAYSLPVTFRASGDAKFPMIISIVSMIFCRIFLAYIFSINFNMGMIGTWAAMFVDWIFKAVVFVWRYFSEKWTNYKVI
ncbi:MATE family efflux transporter [Acetobacterium paludosum]|nr:MATE family efflux transporter [Acetobacterium paludosum]